MAEYRVWNPDAPTWPEIRIEAESIYAAARDYAGRMIHQGRWSPLDGLPAPELAVRATGYPVARVGIEVQWTLKGRYRGTYE